MTLLKTTAAPNQSHESTLDHFWLQRKTKLTKIFAVFRPGSLLNGFSCDITINTKVLLLLKSSSSSMRFYGGNENLDNFVGKLSLSSPVIQCLPNSRFFSEPAADVKTSLRQRRCRGSGWRGFGKRLCCFLAPPISGFAVHSFGSAFSWRVTSWKISESFVDETKLFQTPLKT